MVIRKFPEEKIRGPVLARAGIYLSLEPPKHARRQIGAASAGPPLSRKSRMVPPKAFSHVDACTD